MHFFVPASAARGAAAAQEPQPSPPRHQRDRTAGSRRAGAHRVPDVGASTGADGNYRLVIPGARFTRGRASPHGARTWTDPVSRTITVSPGAALTQNFQMATSTLLLESVVARAPRRRPARKVPYSVSSVMAQEVQVPPASARPPSRAGSPARPSSRGRAAGRLRPSCCACPKTSCQHRARNRCTVRDGVIVSGGADRNLARPTSGGGGGQGGRRRVAVRSRAATGSSRSPPSAARAPDTRSRLRRPPRSAAATPGAEHGGVRPLSRRTRSWRRSRDPSPPLPSTWPASYSNVRRFVRDGQAPPRDAVRIEELVTTLVRLSRSRGEHPFTVVTEWAPRPGTRATLVHVGIQGGGWTPRSSRPAPRLPGGRFRLLDSPSSCRWCRRRCGCWWRSL